jgi:hypothetical protein
MKSQNVFELARQFVSMQYSLNRLHYDDQKVLDEIGAALEMAVNHFKAPTPIEAALMEELRINGLQPSYSRRQISIPARGYHRTITVDGDKYVVSGRSGDFAVEMADPECFDHIIKFIRGGYKQRGSEAST